MFQIIQVYPVSRYFLPFFLKTPDIIFSVMQKPFKKCVFPMTINRFLHIRKKLIRRFQKKRQFSIIKFYFVKYFRYHSFIQIRTTSLIFGLSLQLRIFTFQIIHESYSFLHQLLLRIHLFSNDYIQFHLNLLDWVASLLKFHFN
jgi:hypothetical protein